jgi:hypothetical protein
VLLVGAAAAFGSAGLIYGLRADEDADQASQLFRNGGSWTPDAQTVANEGQRAQMMSRIFISAAVVSAAAAVLITLLGPSGGRGHDAK